jgi:hypothetical protein
MMGVVHLATARPASRRKCATLQLRWKRYCWLDHLWAWPVLSVSPHQGVCDRAVARHMYDFGPCRVQNGYTLFTPWFKVRKCAFDADSTECKSNCIKKGRYCTADSIGDKFKSKYQGAQVWDHTCAEVVTWPVARVNATIAVEDLILAGYPCM